MYTKEIYPDELTVGYTNKKHCPLLDLDTQIYEKKIFFPLLLLYVIIHL